MPCDSVRLPDAAAERRRQEARKKAQLELEADIAVGKRRLIRNIKGEISISNFATSTAAQAGWCEGCVLRSIQQSGNWLVRQKLAAAGITNKPFVAAGHNDHEH